MKISISGMETGTGMGIVNGRGSSLFSGSGGRQSFLPSATSKKGFAFKVAAPDPGNPH